MCVQNEFAFRHSEYKEAINAGLYNGVETMVGFKLSPWSTMIGALSLNYNEMQLISDRMVDAILGFGTLNNILAVLDGDRGVISNTTQV